MARLFITAREIDFISDITKELTKDIIGQVIYYYKPRVDLSNSNNVYDEMTERVFDPPVEIDCTVQWNPSEKTTDRYGHQSLSSIEIYLHYRDLLDRGLVVEEGDFFQFGDTFYEMTTVNRDKIMFGQVEHITGYKIVAKQARKGLIDKPVNGPTGEQFTDAGSVQDTFVQQRGDVSKGDKRQLVSDGVLDSPIGSAQTVRKDGSAKSSFYGDES